MEHSSLRLGYRRCLWSRLDMTSRSLLAWELFTNQTHVRALHCCYCYWHQIPRMNTEWQQRPRVLSNGSIQPRRPGYAQTVIGRPCPVTFRISGSAT